MKLIIQPFSSKISRIAISNVSQYYVKNADLPGIKPFRITAIKDSKPLFSTGKKFLKLIPDKNYSFTLTSISEELFNEVVNTPSLRFKIYSTEAEIELKNVEIINQTILF